MCRQLTLLFLLGGLALAGCMSAGPITFASKRTETEAPNDAPADFDFDASDPASAQQAIAQIDRELLRHIIAETPRGSLVRVHADTKETFEGTLLKANSDVVELMNCIGRKPVPGPNGALQLQTSHTPLRSFETAKLTGFTVSAPPPPDFAPPDITDDSSAVTLKDFLYRDGHRQSSTRQLSFEKPADDTGSANVK